MGKDNAIPEATIRKMPSSSSTPPLQVSVVIPLFNEEQNIETLYSRLKPVLNRISPSHEIVFIDDGSRDRSCDLLRALSEKDPCICLLELARNFGHQVAISAGLDYCTGRVVFVMDADLQDPPELLPQLIAKWNEGYDVVYAIRENRPEGWLKRLSYASFYRLMRRISDIPIPLDAGDFCLMDRRVVDLLCAMPERNRFIRGIRSWIGLRQTGIRYDRQARNAGQPQYTFAHLLYLALDGFISFSHAPLRLATLLGMVISLLSLVLAVFYFVKKLLIGLSPPGFATLVVAMFFLSGVQLITIGALGEYIGRIFDEVKQRPLYIVKQVTRGRMDADPDAQQ